MIKVNNHLSPKDIITADHYKGSIIEKAYGGGDNGLIASEIIKVQLNNKLEKGIIDQDLFDKAMGQLEELVKGGEGSRGGHVIGHTKSGKAVYKGKDRASAKEYKDFSAQDHKDASDLHRNEAGKSENYRRLSESPHVRDFHESMTKHHSDASNSHDQAAHSQIQKEHESGLSTDEKKIVADRKKKQNDKHQRSYDYHKKEIDRYEVEPTLLHEDHHLNSYNFHKDRANFHKRSIEQ